MPMRGVWWFLGTPIALVSVPWATWTVLWLMTFYGPRIPSDLERRCDRLRPGMTAVEVRGVLGAETRETTERECTGHGEGGLVPCACGERVLVWERDGRFVRVGFSDGVLLSKDFVEYDL
jgi:hypothetical protein